MMLQDCAEVTVIAPDDPGNPAKWFALGVLIVVTLFEIWTLWHGKNTISHWLQRMAKAHPWLRWLGILGGGWLIYHLFW